VYSEHDGELKEMDIEVIMEAIGILLGLTAFILLVIIEWMEEKAHRSRFPDRWLKIEDSILGIDVALVIIAVIIAWWAFLFKSFM
jgi:hypothetical protein